MFFDKTYGGLEIIMSNLEFLFILLKRLDCMTFILLLFRDAFSLAISIALSQISEAMTLLQFKNFELNIAR